ncbi:hypothetical protein [Pseudooceanicola sp. C21-150M6]
MRESELPEGKSRAAPGWGAKNLRKNFLKVSDIEAGDFPEWIETFS